MINRKRIDQIVALAHRAALDGEGWEPLIAEIARALNANGAALFTPVLDPAGRNLAADWGCAKSATDDYLKHWVVEDPWFEAVTRTGSFDRAGAINLGRQVLPVNVLKKTAFFNDFARRFEIEELVSLKVCDATDRWAPVTHLSFFSPDAGESFAGNERELLTALWPHLQRAVQTYWVLEKARTVDRTVEHALDVLPHAVWVVRSNAVVEYANAAARALVSDQRCWVKAVGALDTRLTAIGHLDHAALTAALGGAQSSCGQVLVSALRDGERVRRAVLRVAPIVPGTPYALTWPHACALLILDLPSTQEIARLWLRHLAQRYRLTPRESAVLRELAAGGTPEEIAHAMAVSITTLRSHLASLFAKTGCRRQAELVRLAAGA
jgi:DNA-binding CsgD family transcriptional regulator/PAS domain-containing protein